MQPLSLSFG